MKKKPPDCNEAEQFLYTTFSNKAHFHVNGTVNNKIGTTRVHEEPQCNATQSVRLVCHFMTQYH